MSVGLERRALAKAELSDVTFTDDESGRWICGLCVLKLEGPEKDTYGPTVTIDVAVPVSREMSQQDSELALIGRAIEVLVRVADFSPEDIQSRITAR